MQQTLIIDDCFTEIPINHFMDLVQLSDEKLTLSFTDSYLKQLEKQILADKELLRRI